LPRIFNAFEQGGSNVTRQFGGLGLGLTISKKLAELHGGTLTARSEGPGKGATFTLTLNSIPSPTISPSHQKPTAGDETTLARQGMPDRTGMRILLVEDHRDSARILARVLRAAGHHVAVAHSMASAMERIASTNYQLLISDLGLPDGSGLDLMKQIHGKFPGIALTGYAQEADLAATRQAGFVEHFTKPVNIQQLMKTIERLCPVQRGGGGGSVRLDDELIMCDNVTHEGDLYSRASSSDRGLGSQRRTLWDDPRQRSQRPGRPTYSGIEPAPAGPLCQMETVEKVRPRVGEARRRPAGGRDHFRGPRSLNRHNLWPASLPAKASISTPLSSQSST